MRGEGSGRLNLPSVCLCIFFVLSHLFPLELLIASHNFYLISSLAATSHPPLLLHPYIMNVVPPAAGAGAGAVAPQGAWNGPFDPLQFAIIKLLKQISITHHGRAEQVMVIGYARIIANLPQATIDAIIAQRNVVEHNTRTRFLGIGQDDRR